jgi:predicted phage terminase large subunit-like protein
MISTPAQAAEELIRRDEATESLLAFTNYTKPNYEASRHHELIALKLDQVIAGEILRLMIFAPPQHGKSELASRRFPALYLGKFPNRQLIASTYNQDNADDFGRDVKDIVECAEYRALFPGTYLRRDTRAAARWRTTEGGIYISAGVGAGITGKGADLGLIDDPFKDRQAADSKTIRDWVWSWYASTFYTRLSPLGAIVLIMTRWHEDDVAGRLIKDMTKGEGDQWEIVHLPALALTVGDPLGRRPGEALWPEKFDRKRLTKTREVIGSVEFIPLYQGTPGSASGNIFKREWWRYYTTVPPMFYKIQAWDTAEKKGQENDFSVMTEWTVCPSGVYMTNRWKEKVEYPELLRMVYALNDAGLPTHVVVEDKSSGTALVQDVTRRNQNLRSGERRVPILAWKIDQSDKTARAKRNTPIIESGQVFLPERAPWLADYLDTMADFPKAAIDDDVDSTVVGLEFIRHKLATGKPEYETVTSRRSPQSERRVAF